MTYFNLFSVPKLYYLHLSVCHVDSFFEFFVAARPLENNNKSIQI